MISTKAKPSAGAEWPARQRSCAAMTSANCSSVILPLPTSKSVPTTARTILRKNRFAVMINRHSVSLSCLHSAFLTSQMVVLASVCVRQKEAKSCSPIIRAAALFIASKSSPAATRVWLI